jgi:imidazolonepropionase-like amidohydrolase
MAILVEGDTIRSVGPDATLPIPGGTEVVDATGLFVLPGLIDTHMHLASFPLRRWAEAIMRRQIYGGITAVRDMAGDARFLAELQREVLVGELDGPDIFYAALMAGPAFFEDPRTQLAARGVKAGSAAWMQSVDDSTDLEIAVARARGTGASAIKIYAALPGPTVKRIVDEAHRQNFPVWTHAAIFPASPAEVIAAGPDVISHVCLLAWQLSPIPNGYGATARIDVSQFDRGDRPEMASLFRQMKAKDVILDATARVYAQQPSAAAGGAPAVWQCPEKLALRLINQASREGVTISAGTDGDTVWSDPYPALYEELELLSDGAKMPTMDVIRAATSVAARTLGQQDHMGTIEPGKLANMLFVRKNPLEGIRNLRSVAFTVQRGKPFRREDYRPVSQEELRPPQL